nr:MAG TPA: hypothetical protein [Caudoviricetes sp.]
MRYTPSVTHKKRMFNLTSTTFFHSERLTIQPTFILP